MLVQYKKQKKTARCAAITNKRRTRNNKKKNNRIFRAETAIKPTQHINKKHKRIATEPQQ